MDTTTFGMAALPYLTLSEYLFETGRKLVLPQGEYLLGRSTRTLDGVKMSVIAVQPLQDGSSLEDLFFANRRYDPVSRLGEDRAHLRIKVGPEQVEWYDAGSTYGSDILSGLHAADPKVITPQGVIENRESYVVRLAHPSPLSVYLFADFYPRR